MIPEVNIISWKASVSGIKGAGDALSPSAGDLGGGAPLRKFLGSNKHVDWHKTDFNVAKTSNVQDYKHTKN